MDPNKVSAVLNWPAPKFVKQIQRFLGFANFHCRFIRGFSALAAPITAFTKRTSAGPFRWNSRAEASFVELNFSYSQPLPPIYRRGGCFRIGRGRHSVAILTH